MKNKTINYTEYLNIKRELNRMEELNIKIIPKKNTLKRGLGVACLIVAPIPFIPFPIMVILGLSLLGFDRLYFIMKGRQIKNLIKYKIKRDRF